ncbi:unnamed protein product [Schistosoma turkestanicum]|nr:unnamed protein product [Schistosoma turkestanicum]
MHPCYTSSSVLSSPVTTTFQSSQSLSASSQPVYYQSSRNHMPKTNLNEQYNLTDSRHHLYQNVVVPSPSMQHIPNSSNHHQFAHYSQPHISTTISYPSYNYYQNNSIHSQSNVNSGLSIVGHPHAFNSTKNYIVHQTKNSPMQSVINNNATTITSTTTTTHETFQYNNPSIIMNIQSQIPHSQYCDPSNVNRQPSKRPRPPPPPPPPRSGSWIGKISVSTPTMNGCHTTNLPYYNGQYNHKSPSTYSQLKGNAPHSDENSTTTQKSCHAYDNTFSPISNSFVGTNSQSNFNNLSNHLSTDASQTDQSISKRPVSRGQPQQPEYRRQQQLHQQIPNQPVRTLSRSNNTNTNSSSSNNCQSSPSMLTTATRPPCQSVIINTTNNHNNNNSRKEVIEALLNLLIWHHPEIDFTKTQHLTEEIQTFHTILLDWLAKTDYHQNQYMTGLSNLSTTPTTTATTIPIAQYTRRILTHLIRILYSDAVYEEEPVTDDQLVKEIDKDEVGDDEGDDEGDCMNALVTNRKEYATTTTTSNNNNNSNKHDEEGDNNEYVGFPSSLLHSNTNECNQSSVYSCRQQNGWTKSEKNTLEKKSSSCLTNISTTASVDSNILHSNGNNFNHGNLTDSKILPPNTSLMELKLAAMEAIHKLVPLCQPDPNLYERDMGIVQLLTSIHRYTLNLNESMTQLLRHSRDHQNVVTNGNNNNENARINKKCINNSNNNNGRMLNIELCSACPVAEVAALVRLSFDSLHRNAICELGGVHALISLLRIEQMIWSLASLPPSPSADTVGNKTAPPSSSSAASFITNNQHFTTTLLENSLALRRYICMALTNLTYAAPENKAFICRRLANLEALLAQLETGNEELKQVSASVLRNLSWRTDNRSKAALRRVCAAKRLTIAAMNAQRESTLRTTLSALWNLSAHCSQNKRSVCSVDGVFEFLLKMLHLQNPIQNLIIIENSGGILRNISTIIASHDHYRSILHQHNCYPILLNLLRNPPSLTVVVNVCGTLWNLTCSSSTMNDINNMPTSNNNTTTDNNNISSSSSSNNDRLLLLHLGALDLIQQLTQSKHDLIRTSSLAVYCNLIQTNKSMHDNYVDISSMYNNATNQLNESSSSPLSTTTTTKPIMNQLIARTCDNNSNNNDHMTVCNTTHNSGSSSTADTVGVQQQPQQQQHQLTCKRRIASSSSSRTSRLRFGLLSVVFEAESDDELEDDDEDDDIDEDGDEDDEEDEDVPPPPPPPPLPDDPVNADQLDFGIRQTHQHVDYEFSNNTYSNIPRKLLNHKKNSESLCDDDSQFILTEPTSDHHHHHLQHYEVEQPQQDDQQSSNWYNQINCCHHTHPHQHHHHHVAYHFNHNMPSGVDVDVDEGEQTCVYAEEGTPFLSNSTEGSCLELHQSNELFLLDKINTNYPSHQNTNDNDSIPHIYAVEGTPTNYNDDTQSSYATSLNHSELQLNLIELNDFNNRQDVGGDDDDDDVGEDEEEDEVGYLPSPPEDISALVSPLLSMHVTEQERTTIDSSAVSSQFPMPPSPPLLPPLPAAPASTAAVICQEYDLLSSKQTPLIYSRGTSSYLSSVDLNGADDDDDDDCQSLRESEYSSRQKSELLSIQDVNVDDSNSNSNSSNSSRSNDNITTSSNSSSSSSGSCCCTTNEQNPHSNHEFYEINSCADEDVRLAFAEEGTPPPPTAPLPLLPSSVPLHDTMLLMSVENSNPLYFHHHYNQTDMKTINNCSTVMADGDDVDADEDADDVDDDGDNHDHHMKNNDSKILQQCIASAMPSNNNFTSFITPTTTAHASTNILYTDLDDTLKTFAVEDTPPLDMSTTKLNSFNDLLMMTRAEMNKAVDDDNLQRVTSTTTSSSLNDDDDDVDEDDDDDEHHNSSSSNFLLTEVIQSAMPKSGQIKLTNYYHANNNNNNNNNTDCLQMCSLDQDDDTASCIIIPIMNNNTTTLTSTVTTTSGEVLLTASEMPSMFSTASSSSLLTFSVPLNTIRPIPPIRTTSTLTTTAAGAVATASSSGSSSNSSSSSTSSIDPFIKISDLIRPCATVAPMLQSECYSLNSPIVSRSQNLSEQSSKSCLQSIENKPQTDGILVPNSSIPSSSSSSSSASSSSCRFHCNITTDKDDGSSFSSLLSIESVGMEHSLLQECITSAMPRPKSISLLRKQQQQQPYCQQKPIVASTCSISSASASTTSSSSSSSSSSSASQQQQQQPSISTALKLDTTDHQSLVNNNNNNLDNDYNELNNHVGEKGEVSNHCQIPTKLLHPYRVSKSSSYTSPQNKINNTNTTTSSSGSASSSSSNSNLHKSKIPSHHLNNKTTKSTNNHNNNTSTSRSFIGGAGGSNTGTIHFLDHGSDDVQQQKHLHQTTIPTTVMMKKKTTVTSKHIDKNIVYSGISHSITSTTPTTTTTTTNTTAVVNVNSKNSISSKNTDKKLNCASFGANTITNAKNHNESKLSSLKCNKNINNLTNSNEGYVPRRIIPPSTMSTVQCSLPTSNTQKSGLPTPSSVMSKPISNTLNSSDFSLNKQDINVIDVLDAEDISELLQQGAKTVVSDLMKPCNNETVDDDDDDINEKNHDFYNELNDTTNNTTDNNHNIHHNNSQSMSNNSSLELLPEFTELEQSIPSSDNNNHHHCSNKIIETKSMKSGLVPPSTLSKGMMISQASNKTSSSPNISMSNIQPPKYNAAGAAGATAAAVAPPVHHQLSNKSLNNSKFNANSHCNVSKIGKTVISTNSSNHILSNVTHQITNDNHKKINKSQPNLTNHKNTSINNNGNTIYKYKKPVIHPVTTPTTTATINNYPKNSIKPTIKYQQPHPQSQPHQRLHHHQRTAMTEPPSVQNLSQTCSSSSSRSVSGANSLSNLKSTHSVTNNNGSMNTVVQSSRNHHHNNNSKPTDIHQPTTVSMESVYTALVKQNKQQHHSPKRPMKTNKASNNNHNSLLLYAKHSSSHNRSLSTPNSRVACHSIERPTVTTTTATTTVKLQQQSKDVDTFHGVNNHHHQHQHHQRAPMTSSSALASSIACGNSVINTQTVDGADTNHNHNTPQLSNVPKPIRGGRKSLMGRKISPSTVNMMTTGLNNNKIPVAVKPISAVKPTPHSLSNSNNTTTSNHEDDQNSKTLLDEQFDKLPNDNDNVNSLKLMNGYAKCEVVRNPDKPISNITNDTTYNDDNSSNNNNMDDKLATTPPGMWIVRDDFDMVIDECH